MIPLADASAQLMSRAQSTSGRFIVGIGGAPGAGKSTAADALLADAAHANIAAVVVGIDGWHLAHDVLTRLGLAQIKGAPETFDAHGFVMSIERIRNQEPEAPSIWLPQFRREIEDAVAGAIEVRAEHRLVVVEGNYVLMRQEPWARLHALFDEAWMLTPSESTRQARLIARHERHGRDAEAARRHALGSDERNARRVVEESPESGVLQVDPG